MTILSSSPHHLSLRLLPCAVALTLLCGCTVAGPDFSAPAATAPVSWTSWRSADDSLQTPLAFSQAPAGEWWKTFHDPVLDRLQQRAIETSPDLRTAALRYAQARTQRVGTEAQRAPEVNLSGGATRQRQSEYGAGTRLIDVIGGDRSKLASALSEPFTLYQAGFDASWEPDLWGRVQRSVEAADADVQRQAALLAMMRLTVSADIARNYFELRTSQRQIGMAREDIAMLDERTAVIDARVSGGTADHLDGEHQHSELEAARARLPGLLAQEAASINQIGLLLGDTPGQLTAELRPVPVQSVSSLPDLSLGLPSEVALRRPDIRAAEARLHAATANIGIAQANLYPSIRLGAGFGYESYLSGEFSDWGSRAWSVGPSLNLPIFDLGRRKSVVQLRELEQQEAAVAYQKTVLQAWQEIDDTLSAYAAQQQQATRLQSRADSARRAWELAQARYDAGLSDFVVVIDSQRSYLQARRELADSEGQRNIRFIAINKAVGNVP